MKFQDIKRFPHSSYHVNVGWSYLEKHIADMMADISLVHIQPDFQRGYVWTEEQQIAYVEYVLRDGTYGRDLIWNCPSWSGRYGFDDTQPIVLVDGQQRLGAVRAFMSDQISVFGHLYSQFEDKMAPLTGPGFIFNVFELQTEREVLDLYLALNTGGSIHTQEDLRPALEKLERLTKETNT